MKSQILQKTNKQKKQNKTKQKKHYIPGVTCLVIKYALNMSLAIFFFLICTFFSSHLLNYHNILLFRAHVLFSPQLNILGDCSAYRRLGVCLENKINGTGVKMKIYILCLCQYVNFERILYLYFFLIEA